MGKNLWIKEIIPGHHAYLISGRTDRILPLLEEFLNDKWNISPKANPDFHIIRHETLSVDESRKIGTIQSTKTFGGATKIIIVVFNSATKEAQNSLLKVLEEPSSNTVFFLLTPHPEGLLPTLRSRLHLIEGRDNEQTGELNELAVKFIKSPLKDRIKMAQNITEDISEEKKNKQYIVDLIDAIERILYKKWAGDGHDGKLAAFEDLELCRKYLGDRSASLKILLEHIALVLPT